MNLFVRLGKILSGYSQENNDTKMTSKQIWELDRMNYSTKNLNINKILYDDINDSSEQFLKWRKELEEPTKSNKKIVGNCEYCGSGYFDDEKNCSACGSPIKLIPSMIQPIEPRIEPRYVEKQNKKSKLFITSIATVFSYNANDELIFTGNALLDSNMQIKENNNNNNNKNTLQYVYYHSPEPESISIQDVEWKMNDINCPKVVKLILETQITSVDSSNSLIGKLQYIIPKARMTGGINGSILFADPLSVRHSDSKIGDYYGYIQYGFENNDG